jgi:DNA-directed RNA polymerase subunit M/transcription elongation factor TFIIS
VLEISLKCPECGNLLKKDGSAVDGVVVCSICETHYKVVEKEGKICLEESTFNGDDFGEL